MIAAQIALRSENWPSASRAENSASFCTPASNPASCAPSRAFENASPRAGEFTPIFESSSTI
jgi:hypothetical protein